MQIVRGSQNILLLSIDMGIYELVIVENSPRYRISAKMWALRLEGFKILLAYKER